MPRVEELWSPEHSYIHFANSKDVGLVQSAFEDAIANHSDEALELYERRLSPQIKEGDARTGLAFDTSEARLVIDVLASFARNIPPSKPLRRRRAASLIGLTTIHARHEFSTIVD